MVQKYEKDGQVAVLISPGFGAGWSTWCEDKYREFALFDKGLVEIVLKYSGEARTGKEAALKAYLDQQGLGNFYTGGAANLTVEWVDKGVQLEVEEYDGSESLHIIGDRQYFTA